MKWFYNLIKFIVGSIGVLWYIYPFYEMVIVGKGITQETLILLGVCWLVGLITIHYSACIHDKIDEKKDFNGEVPKLARQTRSPEEFEKWLQKQNFTSVDDKKK